MNFSLDVLKRLPPFYGVYGVFSVFLEWISYPILWGFVLDLISKTSEFMDSANDDLLVFTCLVTNELLMKWKLISLCWCVCVCIYM